MNLHINTHLLLAILLLGFISCGEKADDNKNKLQKYIKATAKTYAPDARLALFDIEVSKNDNGYILYGETTEPEAIDALKETLRSEKITFTDSIQLLPETRSLKHKIRGVVKISVANLRDKPRHAAQLVTQATLGTPLHIYKKQGGWYYVQTPDGYLAWVDYGGIQKMTETEFTRWKATDKLIITQPTTNSYTQKNKNSQTISDLVAGDILELVGHEDNFYEVVYPDAKHAFVSKTAAKPYQDWIYSLEPNKENLVKTAKNLMGLPYLWGGTSPKGVDCSGYTKTVFFLNGMIIPRDASQQIHTGKLVDTNKNFENLVKGDLLFFGKPATDSTAERVIHVGMWIGNNRFIHSMGQVHISNFDTSATDFDEYNYKRYLRSKRVLNQKDEGLIYLKNKNIFTTSSTDSISKL